MDIMLNEFGTHDLQKFYVDLGQRLVRHQDARLSLFYLLHYRESRNCNYGNRYLIKYKMDFSDLLASAYTRFNENHRIKLIHDNLKDLLDFVDHIFLQKCEEYINKDSYRHLVSLMKKLDRSIEYFRKEISQTLTYTDELTGLFNRSALDQDMDEINFRELDLDHNHCIALIDIDNFKYINDNYGHLAGDDVLECIADIIQSSVRITDKAYRYGGEEIAIVFKDTLLMETLSVVERLRIEIADYIFISDEIELRVTVSIGISQFERSDVTFRDAIDRADKNLYKAKNSGKNITVY
ncbi:GGDEF domain-containing protein [Vibrio cholerae]|uniref:GGDEF domain-containing protein n=2 Tax=Vibrio cholerae TaxID=666 RepID=UPI00226F5A08|nr:GGDEF domain-containing protein [Vibrio cholerae]MCX9479434.1 GGDEF domain-containing protein [Vibrio cholerae]